MPPVINRTMTAEEWSLLVILAVLWGGSFVMGFANNVCPFNLIGWAQAHVASGLAAILNATTPLFAVVFAHYLTNDERMTPTRVAGVLIGFGGVVIMIGPDALVGATT